MRQYSLMIKRVLINQLNSVVKIVSYLAFSLIFVAISVGLLVLNPQTRLQTGAFLNLASALRYFLIAGLVIYFSRIINRDLKKGYLKNFFTNSFSKQQYFFGNALGHFVLLLLSMFITTILIFIVWIGEIGMPDTNGITFPLFCLFYFFLSPTIIYWSIVFFIYFSFQKGVEAKIQEAIILILGILTIVLIFLFTRVSDNQLRWVNYIQMMNPYYNLVYAVPQSKELVDVVYWWIYLIDFIYTIIFAAIFWYYRPKPKFFINGKRINKYF